MKIFFFGQGKAGRDIVSKIPIGNLGGSHLDKEVIRWDLIKSCHCVWFFGNKDVFSEIYKELAEIGKPVIMNLSAADLAEDLTPVLEEKNLHWVYGPQITLGMNLLTPFVQGLNKANLFWENAEVEITDTQASDHYRYG
jgi:aspartate-semialdehyde dehydrogenase